MKNYMLMASIILASSNTSAITNRIVKAFNPIIDLMKGLSYPTCFVMMGAGIILLITGNKHKALNIMKWAGVGFIMMQFLPSFMNILVDVGNSIV